MVHGPGVPGLGGRPPGPPPCAPSRCVDHLWERSRLEWRLGEPGDPAALAAGFLAEHGLPGGPAGGVCGAALLVSAAAAARLAGADPGPPTPAPEVPDLVVVVYEHRPRAPRNPHFRGTGYTLAPWRHSWTPAAHAAAVDAVRGAIAAGDVYQVNVVGHASAAYRGDPLPALRRVAALPGARYGGLLAGPGWALACASPETLVEVRAGRATTRPIKGTAPATPAGREVLLRSAKERAEHVMIVDLERNDLARVAKTGTVRVEQLYAVRRWCDLWQAESTITAELATDDVAALLRAVCPGGSVTGAPKLAALDEIARREPVGRGPSMGALGWVGPDHIDLGLTIRTVAATGGPDRGTLHVWAGGGITWGSDPDAEVAEAVAKAAPLRTALVPRSLGVEDRGLQHLVDVERFA